MKKLIPLCLFFIPLIFFSSCRNKTVQLLTKKWECVQVENIIPPNTKFQSPQDSANSIQLQTLLQSLSWTFKNNMRYECAIGSRVTVKGKYELMENDKIIVCTPQTKNNINSYSIKVLTENELVLRSLTDNSNIILHFKPF